MAFREKMNDAASCVAKSIPSIDSIVSSIFFNRSKTSFNLVPRFMHMILN